MTCSTENSVRVSQGVVDQVTFAVALYDVWTDFFQFLINRIMLAKIYRCIVSTIYTDLAGTQAICFCDIQNLFVDSSAGFMGVLKLKFQ